MGKDKCYLTVKVPKKADDKMNIQKIKKFLSFTLCLKDYRANSVDEDNWLDGCYGFNGPLRQYFSLYRAISQR